MPTTPDTLLAYFAGVIDSDGWIGVRRSTYAMRVRGDAGAPVYSERVAVKQVEPHAEQCYASARALNVVGMPT